MIRFLASFNARKILDEFAAEAAPAVYW